VVTAHDVIALLDRIARPDVLRHAWEQVRSNRGSAGIDGETLQAVVAYGVERMLEELRELLLAGRYRPQPSRRVYIPKPGRLRATAEKDHPFRNRWTGRFG
jgi:RNA-directed DNA polymerase